MFEASAPSLYLIAGPNGAGKTTTALTLLPEQLRLFEFINADEIARGLSPLDPDSMANSAGRLMIERIHTLMRTHESFAFESTMAGVAWRERVEEARASGYKTHLLFLYLANVQLALARVRERVHEGGHRVPPNVIRRRYGRGLRNLVQYYGSLFDSVVICDNSASKQQGPREILRYSPNDGEQIIDMKTWHTILRKAHAAKT